MKLVVRSSLLLVLEALVLASDAHAQCGTAGPDLAVGDVAGLNDYGTVGAVEVFMPGLTWTNFGSAPIAGNATTSAHPVVGAALYRFTTVDGATRFEEIGQSWVFHGFFFLQIADGCTCVPAPGSMLGPGCSSDHTASILGTQSQLGPRSEIDARTGAFSFPPSSPPITSGADRRLQVPQAALTNAAGARYFLELHGVSAEDSAAGHALNNASYREVVAIQAGGGWQLAFAGPTVQGQAALQAWSVLDAGVTTTQTTVPGEGGRLVLAQRVTHLGAGRWRYEHSLLNVDSHASVRSFEVPMPAGVAFEAAEFHGVAYHSGEPIDGAEWTFASGGGAIAWSCADAATDPNANALRWRTTSTLRYDAWAAPVAGEIVLGRFRAGSPMEFTIAALVPGNVGGGVFCAGDGTATPCPCANESAPGAGEGCRHSFGVGGRLARAGTASISADSIQLHGTGMPNSSALYFQGSVRQNGGMGTVFGDGLRCAGGAVIRLATRTNVAGASVHPSLPLAPSIAAQGGVAPGDTRHYQVWFRNSASFCSSATFNLTNGVSITWDA